MLVDGVYVPRVITDENGEPFIAADDVIEYLRICEVDYANKKKELEMCGDINGMNAFDGGFALLYALELKFREFKEQRGEISGE